MGYKVPGETKEYAAFIKWIEELSSFYKLENIPFGQPKT